MTRRRRQATYAHVRAYYEENLRDREQRLRVVQVEQSYLHRVSGASVLSVGCGPMLFDDARFIRKKPRRLVGLDVNRNVHRFLRMSRHPGLVQSRRLLREHGVEVELVCADIREQQAAFRGSFDTVYASGVLEFLNQRDLSRVARLFHNYLRPGGLLLVIDWLDCLWPAEVARDRENYQFCHRSRLAIGDVRRTLCRAGFRVVASHEHAIESAHEYGWSTMFMLALKRKAGRR